MIYLFIYFSYHSFDFAEKCKGGNFDNINLLYEDIKEEIDDMDFFLKSLDKQLPEKMQKGVFRTNCIDCLDRTNVAQCYISRLFLEKQLCALGVKDPELMSQLYAYFNSCKIISLQYLYYSKITPQIISCVYSLDKQCRLPKHTIHRNERVENRVRQKRKTDDFREFIRQSQRIQAGREASGVCGCPRRGDEHIPGAHRSRRLHQSLQHGIEGLQNARTKGVCQRQRLLHKSHENRAFRRQVPRARHAPCVQIRIFAERLRARLVPPQRLPS